MPRPCPCDRVPVSGPFDPAAHCPLCWHWHHTPALRASWEGRPVTFDPPAPHRPARPLPCVHLGPPLGGSDLHTCELHGDTTNPAKACRRADRTCVGCGDNPAARAPSEVLTTAGIGDFLAVESHLSAAERAAVEVWHNAAVAGPQVEELALALPGYPRLRAVERVPLGPGVPRSLADVQRQTGRPFKNVGDLSVVARMPLSPAFTGSSALAAPLAPRPPGLPDRPFVAVCHRSTWFAPKGRNFTPADWAAVWNTLDRHDLTAVVIGGSSHPPAPRHPRVIDRQGRLSIAQSVEVLKAAAGYMGVDSWPSVLAAQLFPLNRLSIKCQPNCHGWRHSDFYFAPWADFPFRTPFIRELPWT